jgi:hypothetical protein
MASVEKHLRFPVGADGSFQILDKLKSHKIIKCSIPGSRTSRF